MTSGSSLATGAMTARPRKSTTRDLVLSGTAVAVASVLFVTLADRGTATDTFTFVGRFHPLAVHLPIGAIVLVGLLEGLALSPPLRAKTDPAMAIVLRLVLASAVISFALGLLLAHGGRYPEPLLRPHRSLAFGGIWASAISVVVWSRHVDGRISRGAHRLSIGLMLALLGVGAHFGGSMTHGEGYLVEYAPRFVQRWVRRAEPARTSLGSSTPATLKAKLVFDDVVRPVLTEKCGGCHGSTTVKGQLRLDTFDAVMKGGKTGPAIVAGDAQQSLLGRRITLPLSAEGHMPPGARPQLTREESELITFWIDAGASPTTKVNDLLVPDGARTLLAKSSSPTTERAPAEAPTPPPPSAASSPAAALATVSVAPAPPAAPKPSFDGELFRARVAPVLAAKCGRCHGAAKQNGALRTDSLAALVEGGETGPAVVSSQPDRGTLQKRIQLPADDDDHMPPPKAPQLTATELRLLVRWARRLPQ